MQSPRTSHSNNINNKKAPPKISHVNSTKPGKIPPSSPAALQKKKPTNGKPSIFFILAITTILVLIIIILILTFLDFDLEELLISDEKTLRQHHRRKDDEKRRRKKNAAIKSQEESNGDDQQESNGEGESEEKGTVRQVADFIHKAFTFHRDKKKNKDITFDNRGDQENEITYPPPNLMMTPEDEEYRVLFTSAGFSGDDDENNDTHQRSPFNFVDKLFMVNDHEHKTTTKKPPSSYASHNNYSSHDHHSHDQLVKKLLDPMAFLPSTFITLRNTAQSFTRKEQKQMKKSLEKIDSVDDDAADELFDAEHPMPKQKPDDSGPPCILFRYLPNCTCDAEHIVKGGSHCASGGTSRCDHHKCFPGFRRVAKTVKMISDAPRKSDLFKSKIIPSTSSSKNHNHLTDNLHKNYYLAHSIEERLFRTKLDLATSNNDYFIQKVHHKCRNERLAAKTTENHQTSSSDEDDSSSSSTSSNDLSDFYRCRAESYPSNPHQINAHFLRNQRTNSSLIKNLWNKDQPMFLRLYCTTDSRMGITNVELSFASCLTLAVDLMTRDSSVVVDIVMPSLIDHRDNLKEWFVDTFDFEFLVKIARFYGIEVLMSSEPASMKPPLDPQHDRQSIGSGDGCEKCIWRQNLPEHCRACCIADSRVLGGKSLLASTAASWTERTLPLEQILLQEESMNPNVTKMIVATLDENSNSSNHHHHHQINSGGFVSHKDDIFFSSIRSKDILYQLRHLANFSLGPQITFQNMSISEVKAMVQSARTLDPTHWISDDIHGMSRFLNEIDRRKRRKSNAERDRYRQQRKNQASASLVKKGERSSNKRMSRVEDLEPENELKVDATDVKVPSTLAETTSVDVTTSALSSSSPASATEDNSAFNLTSSSSTTVVVSSSTVAHKIEQQHISDEERWKKISTPDQDWNYCINNKLQRLPIDDYRQAASTYNQQRILVVDVAPKKVRNESTSTHHHQETTKSTVVHKNNIKPVPRIVLATKRKTRRQELFERNENHPDDHGSAEHNEDQDYRWTKKHDIRTDERYLLSIRVTGLHHTTFLEERSASWLPALDWLQPSEKARDEASRAIKKILDRSLDKTTYMGVHLRYEEDAFVWTVGVNPSAKKKMNFSLDSADDNVKHSVVDRWKGANKDRVGGSGHRRGPPKRPLRPDEPYFNLIKHMKVSPVVSTTLSPDNPIPMDQIEKLAQDLNVGAVFITNAAPIEEYNAKYEADGILMEKTIREWKKQQRSNKSNENERGRRHRHSSRDDAEEQNFIRNLNKQRKHCPWFTGGSFFDKSKERTRYSSLVDRLIVESSTVGVVWDPFTGLSSFSQKIYDHRCRRMKGLTTFSYSIGAGAERDGSMVLEC